MLNVSGGGVALLTEDAPPTGQALRLTLHSQAARMESIDAQVVGSSVDPGGQRILHVRFIRWIPLDSLLELLALCCIHRPLPRQHAAARRARPAKHET